MSLDTGYWQPTRYCGRLTLTRRLVPLLSSARCQSVKEVKQ